ncbi:MAG: hypothetical protein IPK39_23500 [Sulfuritalea sp.]|nr:hypothetical protein [Sulfuritalea sp.]
MLINCVAYQFGRKNAERNIEQISDYLKRPDCFVGVALRDPTKPSWRKCASSSRCTRWPSRTPT